MSFTMSNVTWWQAVDGAARSFWPSSPWPRSQPARAPVFSNIVREGTWFLINCSSTKNNLSSQILEDGSAVDGRGASNPPQPLLVFHLRHSQLRNIHLLWEAFVKTELKMFSSPSHPPCSISSGSGKQPPPSTYDGSWVKNLKSIRWQIKRSDVKNSNST